MAPKIEMTEEEWKKRLTAEQFKVLRMKGTEMPFSGELLYNKDKGVYQCAACGNPLFRSDHKFDSGTGWPSFTEAVEGSVELFPDYSHGMKRVEVRCSRCGGHLGHVFDDGPSPSRKRFCINCAALSFEKK
uniref:peptide-methionine (R)-S-oxide reductase n=1 Tax=Candidatus Methanomethylicus mesodigestus TaxID=1867258 RepID=A0A7C3J1Q6_9CREN